MFWAKFFSSLFFRCHVTSISTSFGHQKAETFFCLLFSLSLSSLSDESLFLPLSPPLPPLPLHHLLRWRHHLHPVHILPLQRHEAAAAAAQPGEGGGRGADVEGHLHGDEWVVGAAAGGPQHVLLDITGSIRLPPPAVVPSPRRR